MTEEDLRFDLTCAIVQDSRNEFQRIISEHPDLLHDKSTPWLHLAATEGSFRVVDYLLGSFDINYQSKSRTTPLDAAILSGNLTSVEYLLNQGADPNIGLKENGTSIFLAIEAKNLEMVALLIRMGSNIIDTSYGPNETCVIKTSRKVGSSDIEDLLLKSGAPEPTPLQDSANGIATNTSYLAEAISEACLNSINHWKKRNDEQILCVVLSTVDDFSFFECSVNTEESYQRKTSISPLSDKERECIKWQPTDWEFEYIGGESFDSVNRILNEVWQNHRIHQKQNPPL